MCQICPFSTRPSIRLVQVDKLPLLFLLFDSFHGLQERALPLQHLSARLGQVGASGHAHGGGGGFLVVVVVVARGHPGGDGGGGGDDAVVGGDVAFNPAQVERVVDLEAVSWTGV